MSDMNHGYIRRVDLNLLAIFQVLMEERSVTRAARRLFLTQPAVSHALDRLQETFNDPLLIRAGNAYEPTNRAFMAYTQLEKLLPQIEAVIRGPQFNARVAEDSFKVATGDYGAIVLVPELTRLIAEEAPQVHIQVLPSDGGFRRLETNEVDLVLTNDGDIAAWTGNPIHSEPLFRETLVCIVRKGHRVTKRRLTLQRYLQEKHVAVAVTGARQRLVEKILDNLGKQRDVHLTLPYFVAVGAIAETTDLMATLPKRIARRILTPRTQIVPAPAEFREFAYHLVWHPRDDSDSAHIWLRTAIRRVGAQLT